MYKEKKNNKTEFKNNLFGSIPHNLYFIHYIFLSEIEIKNKFSFLGELKKCCNKCQNFL